MAKIVFLSTTVDMGGAETLLLNMVEALRGEHEISVLYFKGKGTLLPNFRDLGNEPRKLSLKTLLELMAELRRNNETILQGWMYHGNLLASLIHLLSGKRGRLVWGVHHSARAYVSGSIFGGVRLRLTSLFARLPEKIVYVSEQVRQEHIDFGYPEGNASVIHNGIDPKSFVFNPESRLNLRLELGIGVDDPVLGAVGRYHPIKDYRTFFRAAAKLLAVHPSLHVVVVGRDLELGSFTNQFKGLRETDLRRIHLLGERQDVPQILCAMDVFALSSLSESFSLALIEALATARCCVCTDVIFFQDFFPEALRTFKPYDAEGMAGQVEYFLGLPDSERAKRGRDARAGVEANFTLDLTIKRYLTLWGLS
ncbi:MAG: glycosyltransferase [Candidatus Cloacimonetes bacterium]|nr:glycosyltransferase [Candidatus Cloacimonadota bacterium]